METIIIYEYCKFERLSRSQIDSLKAIFKEYPLLSDIKSSDMKSMIDIWNNALVSGSIVCGTCPGAKTAIYNCFKKFLKDKRFI